jgi:hypothetical protein
MSRRVLAVGVPCIIACASASEPRPPPETAERAEPARAEPRGDDAPSSDIAERAAKPSSEAPIAGDLVDLGVWCTDHGIEATLEVEGCYLGRLGSRPDDSLWCLRREELDDHRVVYFQALYRVQGKRLEKLVELAYAAGPRPMQGQEPSYYVKLATVVAGDGASFEVSDSPGPGCQEGTQKVREEFSYDPSQAKPIEQLLARVCAARGKYAANGRRLK